MIRAFGVHCQKRTYRCTAAKRRSGPQAFMTGCLQLTSRFSRSAVRYKCLQTGVELRVSQADVERRTQKAVFGLERVPSLEQVDDEPPEQIQNRASI
jgi:hypothetical protein